MRKTVIILSGLAATLSACSESSDYAAERAASADSAAPENQFGFFEAEEGTAVVERVETVNIEDPAEEVADEATVAAGTDAIPVNAPQIAYIYDYGFRVGNNAIAPLQQRHADLCEKKGPDTCRIIAMEQSGAEGDYEYGQLRLAVAADQARQFGTELASSAEAMDGEQVSLSIGGEDLSKKIVDTEARLRARSLLRDRLMDILRSRNGTVAELVEAERGVAQVNEEIDQARSWLTEMKGRVAFSQVTVNYNSGSRSAGSFLGPIQSAVSSIGSILGGIIGAIIVALTVLIPLGLVVMGIVWVWRRTGLSLRRKKDAYDEAAPTEE